LLFARPFLRDSIETSGDRQRVVLIDRSASMSASGAGERAIDRALLEANKAAGEVGSGGVVHWAWFDSGVQPLVSINGRVANAEASDLNRLGSTQYATALTWANDKLNSEQRGVSDIVVISDMQRTGLNDADLEDSVVEASLDSVGEARSHDANYGSDGTATKSKASVVQSVTQYPVRWIDVGRPATSNLAITRVDVRGLPPIVEKHDASDPPSAQFSAALRNYDRVVRPDYSCRVSITFFNYGPLMREDVPVVVTATRDRQASRVRSTLNIGADQAAELDLKLGKLEPGLWTIEVTVDAEDDLVVDNRRWAAIEVAAIPEVLIISPSRDETKQISDRDSAQTDPAHFLALALGGQKRGSTDRFLPVRCDAVDAARVIRERQWPLVAIADALSLDASTIAVLEDFVDRGGRLMAFTGESTSLATLETWNRSSLAPGKFASVRSAGVVPYRLHGLQTQHPLLKPFSDPQYGDLERLSFRKVVAMESVDKRNVLAEFDRDLPAIVEHTVREGRVLWFLSDAGDAWSNWSSNPLYLPIIQQMAADLMEMTGEGNIRDRNIGDPRPTMLLANQSESVSTDSGSEGIHAVSLAPKSKATLTSESESGAFEQTGVERAGSTLYVVNLPSSESDLDRVDEATMRTALGLEAMAIDGEVETTRMQLRKMELWPWLAALLLVFLLFEFTLSNRTPA